MRDSAKRPGLNTGRHTGLSGVCLLAVILCITTAATQAQTAAGRCAQQAATVVSLEGAAQWRAGAGSAWQAVNRGQEFCIGDTLRIQQSRATLRLPNDTVVRLKENTTLKFLPPQRGFWLQLIEGIAHFISRTPEPIVVKGAYSNAGIEGTEFSVSVTAEADTVAVFEGRVEVTNSAGRLALGAGQAATTRANSAPVRVASVNLRDAVAWALYYPPMPVPDSAPPAVRQAVEAGRFAEAGRLLESLPAAQQTAPLLALASALALYRGEVEAAGKFLDRALQRDGSAPAAIALNSIRQLLGGDTAGALRQAQQAVAAAPQSAAALLALSYAQQGSFQLPEAFATVQRALQLHSDQGLLQARAAELALMLGEYKKADRYAQRAAQLSPSLSRTHSVAGFAALNRYQLQRAQQSFQRALDLDAADPLPHLGLGLIDIRRGNTAAGRESIEVAAAQDPGNALIRSYLGKAYYAENRNPLAAGQFTLAQQLDPDDPTPWFYRAQQRQSDNQLLAALDDLDTAIALNDNRAVYRSRLLLDNDNAARSASQARIYRALNFDQLAILSGARAVDQAPAEHSGHRLLAEAYADRPQLENLRGSESLLATLLAPLGAQPLPLGIRETGLLVVDGAGPADMGLNEYNPLFIEEGWSGRLSALGGTQDTQAYEWNLNGLWGSTFVNLGQYRYNTDGFRANNDVEYEISNLLLQHQATPDLGLQLELRRREEERGDIALQFDLDTFSDNLRFNQDTDSARLGANYRLSPNARLLASLVYKETDIKTQRREELFPGFEIDLSSRADTQLEQSELQYHYSGQTTNWIAGASYFSVDAELVNLSGFPPPQFFDTEFQGAYLYSYWNIDEHTKLTAGLSYDDYRQETEGGAFALNPISEEQFNPKLGLEWMMSPALTLRAAALQSLAKNDDALVSIEPTHVAGFSQVYDESQATSTDQYGIGLSYVPPENLKFDIEYVARELEVPTFATVANTFDIDNDIIKLDLYYEFNEKFSLYVGYRQEEFERSLLTEVSSPTIPVNLDTRVIPVTLNFIASQRLSIDVTANTVEQKIQTEGGELNTGIRDDDRFWTLDSSLALRLPRRLGVVSLELRNILDEEFRYRDFNFFTTRPRPQRFLPERSVYLKVNFQF